MNISTSYGQIKLKLYNETPLHRDNFINLVKNGYFTNKIFERVIKGFMVQGGSSSAFITNDPHPESAITYTIPSEFTKKYFHKRGALAAARKDESVNPNKESTATQFYIVHGEKFTLKQLQELQDQLNHQQILAMAKAIYKQELTDNSKDKDALVQSAIHKAEAENAKQPFAFSPEQIKSYTTIGGAPHLDGSYTVFGEVIEGMNVVDKLASVTTLPNDKPAQEIKFTITIVE